MLLLLRWLPAQEAGVLTQGGKDALIRAGGGGAFAEAVMSEGSASEDARGRRASLVGGSPWSYANLEAWKKKVVLRAVAEGGCRGGQGADREGPASCVKGLDLILQERMAI